MDLDTHTNPEYSVGVYIQMLLPKYYNKIQRVAKKKMQQISLADKRKQ